MDFNMEIQIEDQISTDTNGFQHGDTNEHKLKTKYLQMQSMQMGLGWGGYWLGQVDLIPDSRDSSLRSRQECFNLTRFF